MKKALVFILLFCSNWARAQVITFQNNYGDDTAHEEGRTVIQAADSSYFVCGFRQTDTGYLSEGLMMHIDKSGNELWSKYYSWPGATHVWFDDMAQTSDGNFIVTGMIYYNVNDFNVYLAKMDTDGNVLWQNSYGGEGRQRGLSVEQALDSGFIISGYNDSSNAAIPEFYLLKTDGNGDSLWARTYSNDKEQFAYTIALASDSGFVLAGSIKDLAQLAGQSYIVRVDKSGDTLWTRTLTSMGFGQVSDVKVRTNGNIVVCGSTDILSWGFKPMLVELDDAGNIIWFEVYFDGPIGHAYNLSFTSDGGIIASGNDTSGNFYVFKTDGTGQLEWFRKIDESPADWAYCILQTNDGGYVFTGTAVFDDPVFDPQVVLIKLDGNGELSSELAQPKTAHRISLYPNPGRDIVYISNSSDENLRSIQLHDISGRLVRTYNTAKTSLDISGLGKGIYIVKFITVSGIVNSKMVID